MKVTLNTEGRYSLTAETEQDNVILFTITNSPSMNGIQMTFTQAPKVEKKLGLMDKLIGKTSKKEVADKPIDKPTRKYVMSGKYSKPHQNKRKYAKACPVEGCHYKGVGLSVHKRMAHGIDKDGNVHETFKNSNRYGGANIRPVSHPVVQLQDGTYRQLLSGKKETTDFLEETK